MPLRRWRGTVPSLGRTPPPTLLVYDRGGYATATQGSWPTRGSNSWASSPRPARVARCRGRPADGQERTGKTEGIIGTLKTDKYGFNKPKERLWPTLEMAGPRSILSFNLNKLMRDLVRADR